MTSKLFVKDGSNIRQAAKIFVNDGGTVREATKIWANDGGTVRQVYAKGFLLLLILAQIQLKQLVITLFRVVKESIQLLILQLLLPAGLHQE